MLTSVTEDGRQWVGGHGGEKPELFWSREQLEAIPGGAETLDRWEVGDFEPYQRWCDRRSAAIDAADRLL